MESVGTLVLLEPEVANESNAEQRMLTTEQVEVPFVYVLTDDSEKSKAEENVKKLSSDSETFGTKLNAELEENGAEPLAEPVVFTAPVVTTRPQVVESASSTTSDNEDLWL